MRLSIYRFKTILLLALIPTGLFGQIGSTKSERLKGPVKTVILKDDLGYAKVTVKSTFDRSGKLLSYDAYISETDSLYLKLELTYDADNRLIERKRHFRGELTVFTYRYTEDGIFEDTYRAKESSTTTLQIALNAYDQRVREWSEGYEMKSSYDEDGLTQTMAFTDYCVMKMNNKVVERDAYGNWTNVEILNQNCDGTPREKSIKKTREIIYWED